MKLNWMKSALCCWQLHILHTIKLNAGKVPVKTAPQLGQRSKLVPWAGGKLVLTSSLSLPTIIFPPSHPPSDIPKNSKIYHYQHLCQHSGEGMMGCSKKLMADVKGLLSVALVQMKDWNYEGNVHYCHSRKETNQYSHTSLFYVCLNQSFNVRKCIYLGCPLKHYKSKMCN